MKFLNRKTSPTVKISILGCGWLGLPLGKYWHDAGHTVMGSTTREEQLPLLSQSGIKPFIISLDSNRIHGNIAEFLGESEVLVMAIPPGIRKNPTIDFAEKIQHLIPHLEHSRLQKLIFVSSTSVYGEHQGEVDEATVPEPDSESGRQLWNTEQLLHALKHPEVCVLRLGGLLGPDRHPVTFLSGRTGLSAPQAPVNLIQQQEVIEVIDFLLHLEVLPQTVNAVYPQHPEKQAYYQQVAQLWGLQPPGYDESDKTSGKTVLAKVLDKLGYHFEHPI
jgi:nucleoside-diphosphate-sugar epimerase